MNINRRGLITGLISLAVTAPTIVRAGSLMRVRGERLIIVGMDFGRDEMTIFMEKIIPQGVWRQFNQGSMVKTHWNGQEIVFEELSEPEWRAGEIEWR